MTITQLAALLVKTKPMEPVTIHVGQIATNVPNHVALTESHLYKVDEHALNESDVAVTITVQCGELTQYTLRGEWNAIETFLSKNFNRETYAQLMDQMDLNQFTKAKV